MLFPPITLIYIHHNVNVFSGVDYLINLTKEKFFNQIFLCYTLFEEKRGME
ncbi:hypothetical protein HMPREF9518_02120 [Enterococcus faecalis TX1342]|nr:hypothetical protein HMPREF9518_02120 [Enterococcus faecalis TX1342]EPH96241.1 hypothetical protein D921_01118 [Enterococcus faecalis F01966]